VGDIEKGGGGQGFCPVCWFDEGFLCFCWLTKSGMAPAAASP